MLKASRTRKLATVLIFGGGVAAGALAFSGTASALPTRPHAESRQQHSSVAIPGDRGLPIVGGSIPQPGPIGPGPIGDGLNVRIVSVRLPR